MNIHDLNTKTLTDPAYVAFDDGTDTYKAEFNEVMEAKAAEAVAAADLTQNEVAFTSGDAASPTAWANVPVITTGSTLATLFNRISTMVKNVRYIWDRIGTTAMGTTATTITGAIKEHETDISTLNGNTTATQITNITSFAEGLPSGGVRFFRCDTGTYDGTDLDGLNNYYKAGTGIVIKRSSNAIRVVLFYGATGNMPMITRLKASSGWQPWQNFMGTDI